MKQIFTILGLISATASMNAQIVISEVYGGGGGGSAVYANDFVELVNLGTTSATLTNGTLQYASATGTFNSYAALPATITLAPGQKYLIEMVPTTPNSAGAALPTADFQVVNNTSFSNGTTYNGGFNFSANNGKVALTSGINQVTTPTDSFVRDFVGYGTANLFEGTAAAAALDAATSATRTGGDTNNNGVDFAKLAPTPQNSVTGILGVSDAAGLKAANNFVKNTFVQDNSITFGSDAKDVKIYNMLGQVVKSVSVKANSTLDVSELRKGNYIVTGTVNNQLVSQKILKN